MTTKSHCCEQMAQDLSTKCELHEDRYDCPDALITEVGDGYGFIVHDGGRSAIAISFCPWCGANLPVIR